MSFVIRHVESLMFVGKEAGTLVHRQSDAKKFETELEALNSRSFLIDSHLYEVRTVVRGFAAVHPDKRREIARKGGAAAHRAGTAHEFTSEEARIAGRKGGMATHARKRSLEDASKQS